MAHERNTPTREQRTRTRSRRPRRAARGERPSSRRLRVPWGLCGAHWHRLREAAVDPVTAACARECCCGTPGKPGVPLERRVGAPRPGRFRGNARLPYSPSRARSTAPERVPLSVGGAWMCVPRDEQEKGEVEAREGRRRARGSRVRRRDLANRRARMRPFRDAAGLGRAAPVALGRRAGGGTVALGLVPRVVVRDTERGTRRKRFHVKSTAVDPTLHRASALNQAALSRLDVYSARSRSTTTTAMSTTATQRLLEPGLEPTADGDAAAAVLAAAAAAASLKAP